MQITEEQYLSAKQIVEEYEQMEFQQKTIQSMYCAHCQALHEMECFCDSDTAYSANDHDLL